MPRHQSRFRSRWDEASFQLKKRLLTVIRRVVLCFVKFPVTLFITRSSLILLAQRSRCISPSLRPRSVRNANDAERPRPIRERVTPAPVPPPAGRFALHAPPFRFTRRPLSLCLHMESLLFKKNLHFSIYKRLGRQGKRFCGSVTQHRSGHRRGHTFILFYVNSFVPTIFSENLPAIKRLSGFIN